MQTCLYYNLPQLFRRTMHHCFNVKFKICSVNCETSPDLPSAWGWEDSDWIFISGWNHPLIFLCHLCFCGSYNYICLAEQPLREQIVHDDQIFLSAITSTPQPESYFIRPYTTYFSNGTQVALQQPWNKHVTKYDSCVDVCKVKN